MRKNKLLPAALLLLLAGCDYNDKHFDGLDEISRPTDVKKIEYTLTDADYATIGSNTTNRDLADANGVRDELNLLGTTRAFSETLPASVYAPAFIAAKWYTGDTGSSLKLTYNQGVAAPAYLGELEASGAYVVTAADYTSVWGATPADYFTPNRTADNNLPKILAGAVQDAEAGDYLRVTYQYSDNEPGGETEIVFTELNEDFETAVKDADIGFDGWFNKDLSSGGRTWLGKTFNNNYYAQVSGSGSNDTWLITPAIDLTDAVNPTLSFDICTGYYKGGKLQVLISADFNGLDPSGATWEDVTANFYIPSVPESGYGKLAPAGIMNLSAHKSGFYLAFRYTGDGDAGKTATYQIDNLQVGDINTVQETKIFAEDFGGITGTDKAPVAITGWINTGNSWYGASYGGNIFAETTAYNMGGVVKTSLITPRITVPAGGILTFSVNPRYYNADCLTVYVSENFDAAVNADPEQATWTEVTDKFSIPQAQTSDFVSAGFMGLESYEGKSLAVCFLYSGDSNNNRTTTIRIDDVKVVTYSRTTTRNAAAATRFVGTVAERTDVYQYSGSSWAKVNDVSVVNPEDYTRMGITNNYFNASLPAGNYLPAYLNLNFPYAQEENVHAVMYNYNDGTATSVRVDEYNYTGGAWTKNNHVEVVTDQFVLNNGVWNFDPSVVIVLKPGRNQPDIALYYQAIVDYVAATYGTGYYQTGYKNAEYYYGSSAYENNFDLRVSAWRSRHAEGAAYESLSDSELEALMYERLEEAFIPALKANHADMAPMEGIDVLCTIQFGIYTGSSISNCTHEIQYKVTAKGEFEYVENSFKEL